MIVAAKCFYFTKKGNESAVLPAFFFFQFPDFFFGWWVSWILQLSCNYSFLRNCLKNGNPELEGKTKIAISSHFARDIAFNAINPLTLRCVTLIKQDWQQTADLVNYFLTLVVVELNTHFKVKLPTFKVNGSAFCSQFTFTIANTNITEMEKDVRLKTILLFVASNFFCKGTNSKLHLARDSKVVLTQFTFCKESRNPSFIINKKVLDFIS